MGSREEEHMQELENLVKRWAGEVGSTGTTRSRTGELGLGNKWAPEGWAPQEGTLGRP